MSIRKGAGVGKNWPMALGLVAGAAPALPTVTLSGALSQPEGNSATTQYIYTVTRSAASGAAIVPWAFTAGTTSADDFVGGVYPTGGNVNLADGVLSGTFAVNVNGDSAAESDETFTVLISTPSGYTAGANTSATGTILNDDTIPTLGFSGPLAFTIGAPADTLVFYVNNVPTGQTPQLTNPTNNTIVIKGSSASGWRGVVGPVATANEGSISVSVTAPGAIGADTTITVSSQPTIGMSGTTSNAEGSSGSTSFVYTISRSNTDGDLIIPWSFAPGTTSANDFSGGAYPTGGNVTILTGSKTVSFNIAVNGDQDQESDETFTVSFTPPSGYTVGTSSITSTITNDDVGADNGTTVSYATNNIASSATYGGNRLTVPLPNNKIAIGTQGYSGTLQKRVEQIQIFDRTTKTISPPYTVFPDLLRLDDHGVPYSCHWAAGDRIYVFGGGHSNPLQVGVSAPGDYTTYTQLPQIVPSQSGQNGLCYASPVIVGNTLHLYARLELSTMMPLWYGRFTLSTTDGSLTKVDERVLFDLGNVPTTGSSGSQVGTRAYGGINRVISTNGEDAQILIGAQQANYADNWRRNTYSVVHDTAAQTLSPYYTSVGNGLVRSTSTQCPGVTMDANYLIINQNSTGKFGGGGSGITDSAGRVHFIYVDDVDASQLNDPTGLNPLDVYHMIYENGVFGTPVLVPQLQRKNRYDGASTVADGDGLACYKVSRPASYTYQRGGDINVCRWSPTTGWGADTLVDSANSYCALDRVTAFSQYGDDLTLFYAEGVVPPNQGATGGANNFTMGNERTFLRNKAGAIKFAWTPHPTSQAFAARLSVAPTVAQMRSLDALVAGWANSGNLGLMDAAWMLAAWSEEAAMKNLIQDRFNLTKVGAVARRQVVGQTGSALVGAGGYLPALDYVPSTATSLKMALSSLHVSVWGIEDAQQAANDILTYNGSASSIVMNLRNASGAFSGQPNGAGANAITLSNPSSIGFFAMRRTTTTSGGGFRNYESAQFAGTNGGTVSSLPTKALSIFGNDTSTTNSQRALGLVTVGGTFGSNGGEGHQTLAAPGQRFLVEQGVLSA